MDVTKGLVRVFVLRGFGTGYFWWVKPGVADKLVAAGDARVAR